MTTTTTIVVVDDDYNDNDNDNDNDDNDNNNDNNNNIGSSRLSVGLLVHLVVYRPTGGLSYAYGALNYCHDGYST